MTSYARFKAILSFNKIFFFFSTVKVINVELCTVVIRHLELYPFVPLSVTLTLFDGHSGVRHWKL